MFSIRYLVLSIHTTWGACIAYDYLLSQRFFSDTVCSLLDIWYSKNLVIIVQDDSSFLVDVFGAVKEKLPDLSEKVKPHIHTS